MSAELNVKLVLDTSDIQKQLADVQKKVGGSLGKPTSSVGSSPSSKGGVSIADAFQGMLRSLLMYRAIAEALTQLRNVIMAVVNAFNQAKKLYVGGALSGYGTKLQTSRSVASQVLGVGESDLMRFGEAYKYINRELSGAVSNISRNARPLAETNMQWKMLEVKFQSLASTIGVSFKPTLDKLIDGLGVLVDFIEKRTPNIIALAQKAWALTPTSIAFNSISGVSKGLGSLFGGGGYFGAANQAMFGGKKMDEIHAQMKQLPASAWEKMGLVIGGGGGTNYAKDTAHNTKKSNALLESIARHLAEQQRGHNVFQSAGSLP